MKKYVMLALATIFMFSISVQAQDQKHDQPQNWKKNEMKHGQSPMVSPQERSDRMAKQLGLSAEEKAKVKALLEKQDVKRKEQLEKVKKMKEEMKAKIEAERKVNDEELAKIIGQEKFQKFQVMRAEKMGEMKGRMQERMKERKGWKGNNQPTPPAPATTN
jgi:biopolymer transport protein ExbD